ncbi:hypothetical protein LWI28_018606 [Acer negundo]|uniref:Uncharacterized protein n=1 Tax=Acer negundo TaxID=4023 RepID=A0AAD5IN76_ACENE|nr:hypothetical protein LWI28_018606 [Acer negundo]
MFTLIGASSDSASVPTFGSRINRVEIPSKPLHLSLSQGGILKGFRSRCAASKGADSEAIAIGGFIRTEAGSRLTGWIEINRFKAGESRVASRLTDFSESEEDLSSDDPEQEEAALDVRSVAQKRNWMPQSLDI